MAIRDRNISKDADVALKPVRLHLGTTAVSQTAKKTDAVTPGFPFTVEKVEAYALTVTATISVDVHIGSTSVLASTITPVADTPTAGTLSSTLANRVGDSDDILSVKYTTNGTGAATNGVVTVWIRRHGMDGETQTKG